MSNYFNGYYFKHQKGSDTLCLIVGRSNSEEFIQIITNDKSYNVPFIGDNKFSKSGIKLNIKTEEISLQGRIKYKELSPIKYDIMGPLKYFPMECTHGIISMSHKLKGHVLLNGKRIDFTDGIGYIEKDSGISFPKSYVWIQSNDFLQKCSIMVSIADIPFYGFNFQGCIGIIHYNNKEYRFATYLGVKIVKNKKSKIILTQGKYRLEIKIKPNAGYKLNAPDKGEMTRTIIENVSCPANFKFYISDKLIFNLFSEHSSFEYEK